MYLSCTIRPTMAPQSTKNDSSASVVYQDELLALFDALVNVIFCVKGADQRYQVVNTAFVQRTGRKSKREVVGRRAIELFPSALAERYEEQDAALFKTGEPLRDELELIGRSDATLRWYLTTKLPVFDRGSGMVASLVSVSRDLQMPSHEGIEVESLTRVVELVNESYDQVLRVADMAAAADCSASRLERRMKRVFGLTATQYVQRVRVDRATELLAHTDRSLADIATSCGFYDQANFTRKFARLTNTTPAQFRAVYGA